MKVVYNESKQKAETGASHGGYEIYCKGQRAEYYGDSIQSGAYNRNSRVQFSKRKVAKRAAKKAARKVVRKAARKVVRKAAKRALKKASVRWFSR